MPERDGPPFVSLSPWAGAGPSAEGVRPGSGPPCGLSERSGTLPEPKALPRDRWSGPSVGPTGSPSDRTPLLTLGWRLRSLRPPSLSALVARLEQAQEYEGFVALVREFLSEREGEILGEPTPSRQIAAFADRFEDRYFPLDEQFKMGDVEGYQDLTSGIPVILLGFSPEDYHNLEDFRPGYQLMTYLLAAPHPDVAGARVALGEACREHVPLATLRRVPEGGIDREDAHRLFEGTPYEGLAHWADMLSSDTGNGFLDLSSEDLWYDGLPNWDKDLVARLTREWQQAEAIQEKVHNLAQWLEKDPTRNVGELLKLLKEERHDDDHRRG